MSDRLGYLPDTFHYAYKPLVVKSDFLTLWALNLELHVSAMDFNLHKKFDIKWIPQRRLLQ